MQTKRYLATVDNFWHIIGNFETLPGSLIQCNLPTGFSLYSNTVIDLYFTDVRKTELANLVLYRTVYFFEYMPSITS